MKLRGWALVAVAFAAGFVWGRAFAPAGAGAQAPPAIEVRRGQGDWLQVWRDGRLSSEWQPSDGAIYTTFKAIQCDEFLLLEERLR